MMQMQSCGFGVRGAGMCGGGLETIEMRGVSAMPWVQPATGMHGTFAARDDKYIPSCRASNQVSPRLFSARQDQYKSVLASFGLSTRQTCNQPVWNNYPSQMEFEYAAQAAAWRNPVNVSQARITDAMCENKMWSYDYMTASSFPSQAPYSAPVKEVPSVWTYERPSSVSKSQSPTSTKISCKKTWKVILTAEHAAAIYQLKPPGTSKKSSSVRLSRRYGVSPKTIRDIWNRATWTKATRPLWDAEAAASTSPHVDAAQASSDESTPTTVVLLATSSQPLAEPAEPAAAAAAAASTASEDESRASSSRSEAISVRALSE